MKFSQNVVRTRKQVPSDETAKNAKLLIQAGFIHKEMAGVYNYLPLGLRVIENIKAIVREEMNATGASEMLMSSLQRKDVWEMTDRWDDKKVDIWFKSTLAGGSDIGLGWSHEEPITDMVRHQVASYRDLPVLIYQFQNKMRNELRAKSGIMRGREFIMKDLYSYHATQDEHQAYYDKITQTYLKIFERLGIGDITFLTFASGGAFTEFSHEFQTISDAGEDTIYLDRERKVAVNEEVLNDDVLKKLDLKKDNLDKVAAAEIGNIFSFGTSKTEQLGLSFSDSDGEVRHAVLGSYGIGISRVMGVIAELMADKSGLVWPEAIAPADFHLVRIGESAKVKEAADSLYTELQERQKVVLYDDRNERVGMMLQDADLIGVPQRLVVSEQSLKSGGVEWKHRSSKDTEIRTLDLSWL